MSPSGLLFRVDVDAGQVVFCKTLELFGVDVKRRAKVAIREDSANGEPGSHKICQTKPAIFRGSDSAMLFTIDPPCPVFPRRVGHNSWIWVGLHAFEVGLSDGFVVRLELCLEAELFT